jgi:hypothetical protein
MITIKEIPEGYLAEFQDHGSLVYNNDVTGMTLLLEDVAAYLEGEWDEEEKKEETV